jgi:hypothetical protein
MADALGTWYTADIDLSALLEPIQPILDAVDSVIQILIDALTIISSILEVIKSFIIGLLDPLKVLIEAILNEIRGFLQDLRNLGAYFYTGDLPLAVYPFSGLKGGFQAFQRRITTAFVDSQDLNRPIYSPSTAVLSVYFYVSASVEDLHLLLDFIVSLVQFFNLNNPTLPYPSPTSVTASYGGSPSTMTSFTTLGTALALNSPSDEFVLVQWKMPAGQAGFGSFGPAPAGFILDVSTTANGLLVLSDTPNPQSNTETSDAGPSRIVLPVADPQLPGSLLRVFGGTDALRYGTFDEALITDGTDINATTAYFVRDQNSPAIPLTELVRVEGQDQRRYLGRSFFVRNGLITTMSPGQGFSAVIPKNLLPYDATFDLSQPTRNQLLGSLSVSGATQPTTYSVVVRAVTKPVADQISATATGGSGTAAQPNYGFNAPLFLLNSSIIAGNTAANVSPQTTAGAFSPLSPPVEVVFPGTVAQAILSAALVVVLSRGNLPVVSTAEGYQPNSALVPTGLESVASTVLAEIGVNGNLYKVNSPIDFRTTIKTRLYRYLARVLPQLSAPPDLIIEVAGPILAFRWDDAIATADPLTLVESLSDSSDTTGLFPSPQRVILNPTISVVGPDRAPAFASKPGARSAFFYGQGSCDNAPVLVWPERVGFGVGFCRNLFSAEVYASALQVLTLTSPFPLPVEGLSRWQAVKLFPNGFPALISILDNLEQFLLNLLDGLDGIADAIIAFIDAIQARITQLQAFLVQIQSLLDITLTLRLGTASVLVTVDAGSDRALRAFTTAENKPPDTGADFGFGFALVTGGVPSVILDLLSATFAAAGG